jgi:hypothetical protein
MMKVSGNFFYKIIERTKGIIRYIIAILCVGEHEYANR